MSVPTPLPTSEVWPLKTAADFRDALHRLTAILVPLLVGAGYLTDNVVAYWSPLVFSVIDPLFSLKNSEGKRQLIYGVAWVAQNALIVFGLANEVAATTIAGVVLTVVNSLLASYWTPNSTTSTR